MARYTAAPSGPTKLWYVCNTTTTWGPLLNRSRGILTELSDNPSKIDLKRIIDALDMLAKENSTFIPSDGDIVQDWNGRGHHRYSNKSWVRDDEEIKRGLVDLQPNPAVAQPVCIMERPVSDVARSASKMAPRSM